MADHPRNPYRSDRRATDLFYGREALLADLLAAFRSGRGAIRAVMGGRGIGKSSLASRVAHRLGDHAKTVIVSGSVDSIWKRLARDLAAQLDLDDPVRALVSLAQGRPEARLVLIFDEIERVLNDHRGRDFLDNVREAYEQADDQLGVLVLGGTEVRDLLRDAASPFLRMAGGVGHLAGLSQEEAARLLREPLGLEVPDDLVASLWAETAGHPLLLQMFMERAVALSSQSTRPVVECIPEAINTALRDQLGAALFPIWWSNLRDHGQRCYQTLAATKEPVVDTRWVEVFGDDPRPWLDVLESTGVAHKDEHAILPRGLLFHRWAAENHSLPSPSVPAGGDALDAWLAATHVDTFEALVVRAIAQWTRATIEFPAVVLRTAAKTVTGNDLLQPDVYFQVSATVTLLQHRGALVAEPEALSAAPRTRSDIKVRDLRDPSRRACLELKIFGRNHEHVVSQALGYATPDDQFAAVIMIDRQRRPLRPAYESECFADATALSREEAPSRCVHPAFFTTHARSNGPPLRVWHFLMQLAS